MPLTANHDKMHTSDRVFSIKPIEGSAKSDRGLVDSKLFTGQNKLHAVSDEQTGLWRLKYDSGILPQAMKQQFTSFSKLKKFAEDYFKKRNIEIQEITD